MRASIFFGGHSYHVGDLIAIPPEYPPYRDGNGKLSQLPRYVLVLYNDERDEMRLEPVTGAVARELRAMKQEVDDLETSLLYCTSLAAFEAVRATVQKRRAALRMRW